MPRIAPVSLRTILLLIVLIGSFSISPQPAQAADIEKSGVITSDETWTSDNLYKITGNLTIDSGVTVTIQAGTIIKFLPDVSLDVLGILALQGTPVSPVVFTSYYDDSFGGDTDGTAIPPARGDWGSIVLQANGTIFQYARVRYASEGLRVYNTSSTPLSPPILNNTFDENLIGVYLWAASGDINSQMQGNSFTSNTTGLQAFGSSLGYVLPGLSGNRFEYSSLYPLYLLGNSFPTYSGEVIENNARQAIAVADQITLTSQWPNVNGLPYLVADYLEVADDTALYIPAGMVVKFEQDGLFSVYGDLELLSGAGSEVIFTSLHDDTYGGDTDGAGPAPAAQDWAGVELYNSASLPTTAFKYARLRYSTFGLSINNGLSTHFNPEIANCVFEAGKYGLITLAGSSGDINSAIHDNLFLANEYGLQLAASSITNGASQPALSNNTFQNSSAFPIELVGSAFPTYSGNSFVNSAHPAIAASGVIRRSGAWLQVNNMPYVVTANLSVEKNAALSLPAGLVVKFDDGRNLTIKGGLSLPAALAGLEPGSPAASPVIFTSYHDDSFGGDSDAEQVTPTSGSWGSIKMNDLADSQFQNARVRYAVTGLQIYNSGAGGTFTIQDVVFDQNTTGLLFSAQGSGNLSGTVIDCQFVSNSTGIKVEQGSGSGLSQPNISNCNLVGNGVYAVNNLQTAYDVLASGNWWGAPNGPYHPSTNPSGWGDPVSDHVIYDSYLTAPPFTPLVELSFTYLPLLKKK